MGNYRHRDAHGETPREHEGRDWGEASRNQGTRKMVSEPREAGNEAWNTGSLRALLMNQAYRHLDLRLSASRTARQSVCVVGAPSGRQNHVRAAQASSYTRQWRALRATCVQNLGSSTEPRQQPRSWGQRLSSPCIHGSGRAQRTWPLEAPSDDPGLGGEASVLQMTGPQQPMLGLLFISCCHHFGLTHSKEILIFQKQTSLALPKLIRSLSHKNPSPKKRLQDDFMLNISMGMQGRN